MTTLSEAPPSRVERKYTQLRVGPAGWPGWILPTAGVVIAIGAQELLVRSGILSATDFPPFSEIIRALVEEMLRSSGWQAVGNTLFSSVIGLAIAALTAIPIGIMLATSQVAFRATRLIVEFLRPIPPITIVPLAILIFGTQLEMKLVLIVFGCFWPILVQTMAGVLDVDPVLTDVAKTAGFTRMQRFRQVVLPTASPYIATGLRLSASFSVGLSIVSELIGGAPGLGLTIYQAQLAGEDGRPLMFAVVILAATVGMLMEVLFRFAERRLLRWHESYREVQK